VGTIAGTDIFEFAIDVMLTCWHMWKTCLSPWASFKPKYTAYERDEDKVIEWLLIFNATFVVVFLCLEHYNTVT